MGSLSPSRTARTTHVKSANTLLIRTATPVHRQQVDKMLADVFSEECLACRHLRHHPGYQSPAPSMRHRMTLKDNHVLRRRRSEIDVRGEAEEAPRSMSLSRTFSTYGNKRNSLTLSIKRGLSIGSQDGFTALAQASRPLQSTPSSPRSYHDNELAVLASPVPDQTEFVHSPASDAEPDMIQFGGPVIRHSDATPAYTSRAHSDSSTASSIAPPVIRRKSSFSLSSLTARTQTGRTHSVPASPAASRPVSLIMEPAYRGDVSKTASPPVMPSFGQVDEKLHGGYKLRSASSFFGRSFRSKSFDGAQQGYINSQNSSPDELPSALPSISSEGPGSVTDGHARTRSSTATSVAGSDTSGLGASEAETSASLTEDLQKPAPRRQRSIRFFGLNRFTRISGSAT